MKAGRGRQEKKMRREEGREVRKDLRVMAGGGRRGANEVNMNVGGENTRKTE